METLALVRDYKFDSLIELIFEDPKESMLRDELDEHLTFTYSENVARTFQHNFDTDVNSEEEASLLLNDIVLEELNSYSK